MKVVDVNVLIYAADSTAAHHHESKRWLDRALAGGEPVGFDWSVLTGFVRLTTHPRISATPFSVPEATAVVEAWLGARAAQVLHPGSRHLEYFGRLLEAAGTGGNLVNDAHIAALALEHKATVVTFDSDFGKFPGVKWEQPR